MRIMNFPMSSSLIIMDLRDPVQGLNMKGLKESSAWKGHEPL